MAKRLDKTSSQRNGFDRLIVGSANPSQLTWEKWNDYEGDSHKERKQSQFPWRSPLLLLSVFPLSNGLCLPQYRTKSLTRFQAVNYRIAPSSAVKTFSVTVALVPSCQATAAIGAPSRTVIFLM